jgi:predicted metal-dependent peptidase
MIELEDDVREFVAEGANPFGLNPGANMLQWVAKRRRMRGVDWQSRLNKLLSSSYTSAKVHGASDLSYTVRNPNQPEFGVVLQGLHDYAPTIVVIQDVSGSMISNDGMNKSMSAFTDLCGKVLGRFNSPVTWVTVDAGIIDVGSASSWNKHQQKRWSYGFGGTEIAPAIEQVMTGKLVWKGKKYPKADLTIISTDCIFEWPKRRPVRNGKLLVISVEPDRAKLEKFLPKWVDRKRELVIIEN